jgi:endonuclease YncB( thermonuclease family)
MRFMWQIASPPFCVRGVTAARRSRSVFPMASPRILFRSVVAGTLLTVALCTLPVAAEKPERPSARDSIRTYRPRTPIEFFNQEIVRFERVRVDMNGLIYADGRSLNLYGAVFIPRNRICTSPQGARWACGQRAFMALRNLLEGKPIACRFKHMADVPKAACSVGDDDIAQFLLAEGWAELAEGVTEEIYVGAHTSARRRKAGIWADGPP